MGSGSSQPKTVQSNSTRRRADRIARKGSNVSNDSAVDQRRYAPSQSTGNPPPNARLQSPPNPRLSATETPFAASDSPKRRAPARASPRPDAGGSRSKHTPLERRDIGRTSKRSSRSSLETARTPEEKKSMGSGSSQPKTVQSNSTRRRADRLARKGSNVSNDSAVDQRRNAPLQSTGNPPPNVRIQSPPNPRLSATGAPFAASDSQKRRTPARISPRSDAGGSRSKHPPLERRDIRRTSKRSSRSSLERARTPEVDNEHDVGFDEHENGQLIDLGNGGATGMMPSQKPPSSAMSTALPPIVRDDATGRQANHFCAECPHCRRKSMKKPIVHQQLPWITDKPVSAQKHIIMDHYDEDAVHERFVSQHGRPPGRYDYLPNIAIHDKEPNDRAYRKYYTSPLVARMGPPITPTRTPYMY